VLVVVVRAVLDRFDGCTTGNVYGETGCRFDDRDTESCEAIIVARSEAATKREGVRGVLR